jgi:hypothetical protein
MVLDFKDELVPRYLFSRYPGRFLRETFSPIIDHRCLPPQNEHRANRPRFRNSNKPSSFALSVV